MILRNKPYFFFKWASSKELTTGLGILQKFAAGHLNEERKYRNHFRKNRHF